MKNMLTGRNGTHFRSPFLHSFGVFVIGLGLSLALWSAALPTAEAQSNTQQYIRSVEAELPQGKTLRTATKDELLSALCKAIRKQPNNAPQYVRVTSQARRQWSRDIIRTAFECVGTGNCGLFGRILRSVIGLYPDDATMLTEFAIGLAPDCAGAFGGRGGGTDPGDDGEGNFGPPPGNQNPPPGSVGGGGGQGNVVGICHNGRTIFVSPQGAENHLRTHLGDTLGPCQVTPTQNQ